MPDIGKWNRLKVARRSEFGLFLDGGDLGEILLPNRYVTKESAPGDILDTFLMLDSEDRLTAITTKPYAMVDEFAVLRVVSVTNIGAFLDWGLPKDLLVPFREQQIKMVEGQSYAVRIYIDEQSNRIAASSKLDKYVDLTPATYAVGDRVDLFIAAKTDLGFKAIINDAHWGMIFFDKVFKTLKCGQRLEGYIQHIREDGKIGLSLDKPGYEKISGVAADIIEHLEAEGGFMSVTDKSPPEQIYALFGVSKKSYKKAIGSLYNARRIVFEDGGTRLAGSRRA